MKKRSGNWIQTHSGERFYPFDPRKEEIILDDIVHALSLICRFVGHCSNFYSVAQHSVLVSQKCTPEYMLEGLLHDAAEAYISDIAHPIKRNVLYKPIIGIEDDILNVIYEKFGVNVSIKSTKSVKLIDKRMLYTEKRDLMAVNIVWGKDGVVNEYEPYDDLKIKAWDSEASQLRFYQLFNELYFKNEYR